MWRWGSQNGDGGGEGGAVEVATVAHIRLISILLL